MPELSQEDSECDGKWPDARKMVLDSLFFNEGETAGPDCNTAEIAPGILRLIRSDRTHSLDARKYST